jgi:hypothetical protein
MKNLIVALSLLASGAAFANDAADDIANRTSFVGELTRAEVRAETLAAREAGTLALDEFAANRPADVHFHRSREDVRAEAAQAAGAHRIAELY